MSDSPSTYIAPKALLSPQDMRIVTEAGAYLGEIREIHENIQAQIEAMREAAQREGFEEGYQDGRRAAFDDLANAVAVARAKVTASESDLFAIMMTAIEQLIGTLDRQDLARMVLMRALQDTAEGVSVTIHTSMEDRDAVMSDVKSLVQTPGLPEIRSVEADPLLKPSELVLETPKGRIHVGLKHQINRLNDALQRLEAQG